MLKILVCSCLLSLDGIDWRNNIPGLQYEAEKLHSFRTPLISAHLAILSDRDTHSLQTANYVNYPSKVQIAFIYCLERCVTAEIIRMHI